MKINLRNDIARLVFTFEGVEYNLTNKFGRIIEDPSEAFIAFVESTPELVIDADDDTESEIEYTNEDGSKKKNSKKSKD